MYIVLLYGRVQGVFEDKLQAERYRTRLACETYMNPTVVNLFSLDYCPKTELREVKKDYHLGGYIIADSVLIAKDQGRITLRDDEDLPFD